MLNYDTLDDLIKQLQDARKQIGGDAPVVFGWYNESEARFNEIEVSTNFAVDEAKGPHPDPYRCWMKEADDGDKRVLALLI